MTFHVALNSLMHEKYIIRDAANRRESREYVQKILRLIKDADFTQVKNQFDIMFNDIDLKIKISNIRRFKKHIKLNEFLIDINEVKHD